MLTEAGLFLLNALIGFLTFALLLRFYFQAFRVSFRNQIGAFVVQLTNWLVMPLRKVLPGFFGWQEWFARCADRCSRAGTS